MPQRIRMLIVFDSGWCCCCCCCVLVVIFCSAHFHALTCMKYPHKITYASQCPVMMYWSLMMLLLKIWIFSVRHGVQFHLNYLLSRIKYFTKRTTTCRLYYRRIAQLCNAQRIKSYLSFGFDSHVLCDYANQMENQESRFESRKKAITTTIIIK